jgi:hypothetical protein
MANSTITLSKKRQVINHLSRGWGIDSREAKTKYGVQNLRATMSDIREQVEAYGNWEIETVENGSTTRYFMRYTLSVEPVQEPENIERIDALGGAVKAIENGYVQQEIQDAAYAYQMDVEKGERVVVGLNSDLTGVTQELNVRTFRTIDFFAMAAEIY